VTLTDQEQQEAELKQSGQGHYATHLSDVNENNEVVSTEDILNERGVLLVKKGTRLTRDVAQRLRQHALDKPLENQVQISNSLTRDHLAGHFYKLFDKYDDVKHVHKALRYNQDFDLLLQSWDFHPVISQKLTVLLERMPVEFEKGLFSAWLSSLIAREMRLDNSGVMAVFTAGLIHDIGLLHIDPQIVFKSGTFTPPEWRAIQSHTVVGKILLGEIKSLDPRIAKAVFEHHERCDGIGYPARKTGETLDEFGQIVGMADAVQAIRVNQFHRLGRNLRDLQPNLQMNADIHYHSVYEAMTSILRRSGLSTSNANSFDSVQALVDHLVEQWQGLSKIVGYLEALVDLVSNVDFGAETGTIALVFQRLQSVVNQSGLVQDEIGQWLEQSKASPDVDALSEYIEVELMLNELKWQLKNARYALEQSLDLENTSPTPHTLALKQMADDLSNILEPKSEQPAA
jgi:HD-GYP domain-containing protein (c-di-GMP phosphodiesterase class II)